MYKLEEFKLSVDLNKYQDFVKQVTSSESLSSMQMYNRMIDIETVESKLKVNMALLMTGAIGIASEGGEFAEIVKKCVFQGKPMDDETQFHIKRELGDIIWYWINSCTAMGIDPNEVIAENVNKLKSRYPGGEFDVHYSENRKDGDL
jgi:NTP pyrophosphatase (non-canonical NTP hydrolase)